MSALQTRVTTLIAALLLLSPAALAAQGLITVFDFASGSSGVTHETAYPGELRRGVTSTVRVAMNQIAGVADAVFGVSGGVSFASSITRGLTSSGTPFIQVKLDLPDGQAVGSYVAITLFGSPAYRFKVVHKGQINTVNFVPLPQGISQGQPFEVTVTGDDLGDGANLAQLSCHSVAPLSRTNSAFKVRVTKLATCSSANLGPFSFTVQSSAEGDPDQYATSQGTKSYQFGPYVGCTAEPILGTPVVISPTNNQVLVAGNPLGGPPG